MKTQVAKKIIGQFAGDAMQGYFKGLFGAAGKAGKALATRGQELAYSNSVIDRWINKYIRSPFQPQGDLGPELFASETAKAGLKARDTFRAEELVNNITKEVNNIYPKADKFFDSSTKDRCP